MHEDWAYLHFIALQRSGDDGDMPKGFRRAEVEMSSVTPEVASTACGRGTSARAEFGWARDMLWPGAVAPALRERVAIGGRRTRVDVIEPNLGVLHSRYRNPKHLVR